MINNKDLFTINNNDIEKETEGIDKLLKKLDTELKEKEHKKKCFQWNNLNFINLDLGLDTDLKTTSTFQKKENNNGFTNNVTININNINNNINNNNDYNNKKQLNFENQLDFDDNIIFKEIKFNDNSKLKQAKKNEKINSSINNNSKLAFETQNEEKENNDNIIIKTSNNIKNTNNQEDINGLSLKNENNLLISSINKKNEEDNFGENEEFDFDVKEIIDIQKEELDKLKKIKEKNLEGDIDLRRKNEVEEKLEEEAEKKRKEEEELIKREEEEEKIKKEEERARKEEEEEKERKKIEEEQERKRQEMIEEEKKKEEERKNKEVEEERIRLELIKEEEEERRRKEEEDKKIIREEDNQQNEIKNGIEENYNNSNNKKEFEINDIDQDKIEQEKQNDVYKQNEEKEEAKENEIKEERIDEKETEKKEELKEDKILINNEVKKEELNNDKDETNGLNQNNTLEFKYSLIHKNLNNSKIFRQLSENQQKELLSILENVIKYRESMEIVDDRNSYPTIILDLDKKEKTLDDIIPDFRNKIKNDSKEEFEKRKNSYINSNYFEGLVETNPLLELIPECKISHIELLQKIYQESGLKNIPRIEDNYQNNIFQNELIEEYYSPIGQLEDLKGFTYKYNFDCNTKIYLNSYKNFNYWRSVKGDGNSFYRTFMFSLIEYYILYNIIEELRKLISEISSDNLIEEYNNNKIDYKLPFYIFGTILHLLSKGEIKEAYDIFINSYLLKDGSFDKILIIYLRYISYLYIDEVIKICDNENYQEGREEKIVPKNINKNLIKTMNLEPNFFIICLMPYLFDINVTFMYIDRDFAHSKDGIINFIDEENTDEIPLITIAYFYSSYFKIYSPNFIQENEEISEIFQSKLINLSRLTINLINPKKCQICKSNNFILFIKQKFKICKECLEKYINNICEQRREALTKDNFIGLEYYSRAFQLKDNYILNDYEFIEIKDDINIINYLQYSISTICSKCEKTFAKKNLNNIKCKCLLCDKCLEDMILKVTKGLKILNAYEKKDLEKIKCSYCKMNFSYEDAIDNLKDIKEIDRENAIKRMNNYVNTLCLVCGDKIRQMIENNSNDNNSNVDSNNKKKNDEEENKYKNTGMYKDIKNYKRLKIRKENEKQKGIDYLDDDHFICINCYDKYKNLNKVSDNSSLNSKKNKDMKTTKNNSHNPDIENKIKNNKYYVDFDDGECFCYICNKKHYFIDRKANDEGCFSSGCNIN